MMAIVPQPSLAPAAAFWLSCRRFLFEVYMATPSTSSTFVFGPAASTKLDDLSRTTGLSKEELLRKALTLLSTAYRITQDGGQLVIKQRDGDEVEVDPIAIPT